MGQEQKKPADRFFWHTLDFVKPGEKRVKGGAGSGEQEGHPFRGNQWTRDGVTRTDRGEEKPKPEPKPPEPEIHPVLEQPIDADTRHVSMTKPEIRTHNKIRNDIMSFTQQIGIKTGMEKGVGIVVGGNTMEAISLHRAVRLPPQMLDTVVHMVHNHPSGASLSPSDVANMWARRSQKSIEAVTEDGTVYRLDRLTSGVRTDIAEQLRTRLDYLKWEVLDKYPVSSLVETLNGPEGPFERAKPLFIKEMDRCMRVLASEWPNEMRYTVTKVGAKAGRKKEQMPARSKSQQSIKAPTAVDYGYHDDRLITDEEYQKLRDKKKGDKPGHPFRGNQWTTGEGGGGSDYENAYSESASRYEDTRVDPNAPRTQFHGTAEMFMDQIMKEGIRPDRQRIWEGEMRGERGRSVFMADNVDKAIFWGFDAHQTMVERFGGKLDPEKLRCAVIEIEIPKNIPIKPDELLEDGHFRRVGNIPPEWIKGYTVYKKRATPNSTANDELSRKYEVVSTHRKQPAKAEVRRMYVPLMFIDDDEGEEESE